MMNKFKAWVEAMRLRTLPVSIGGVLGGLACALTFGDSAPGQGFRLLPFLICLVFAVLAQIVSNFANEYYDFKTGVDKKGREGFRRGVTEGDISPVAMKRAIFILLAADCALGCSLIIWGGWWLIWVGLFIAIFALAYSGGPFPLSKIGLGDIAVVIFYGLVPVIFTSYVVSGTMDNIMYTAPVGFALGLLADNVLIVNNYRDLEDDKEAGKLTTVVIFGRKIMLGIYALNFTLSLIVIALFFVLSRSVLWVICWAVIEVAYILLFTRIRKAKGATLNPLLGMTAMLMLLTCAAMVVASAS